MNNPDIPKLVWNRSSTFWHCKHTHPDHGNFTAEYSDSGVITISVNSKLVRHQKSTSFKNAQAVIRRNFLTFYNTGDIPPRKARVAAASVWSKM